MWNLLERYAMIKAALANALDIDLYGMCTSTRRLAGSRWSRMSGRDVQHVAAVS